MVRADLQKDEKAGSVSGSCKLQSKRSSGKLPADLPVYRADDRL